MQVVLATRNQGKVKELQAALTGLSIELRSLDDVGIDPQFDVEEVGNSFQEIAELKAREYAKVTKLPTVADDSGLCLVALNNFPGIHSKRFIEGSDHDRNIALLAKLAGQANRAAYFVTVLCLFDPATEQSLFFEGRVDGHIAMSEQGQHGFGYDPIFIPDGYTKTFAELGAEVKDTISHRARAVQKLRLYLEKSS